jgi:hypothetical protein
MLLRVCSSLTDSCCALLLTVSHTCDATLQDYENLLSLHNSNMHLRVTRVGIVRYSGVITPDDEDKLTKALLPFDCVPVFLERSLARRFYRDFCKVSYY